MLKLLLVDDEEAYLTANEVYFTNLGYQVYTAPTAAAAFSIIKSITPDCIVMDIVLPDVDGYELCRGIKKITGAPVIFRSNLSSESSRIHGFLSGGDDYVAKPCSMRELELRIMARIKQHSGRDFSMQIIRYDPLCINLDSRVVTLENKPVTLATMEFNVLAFLAKTPDKVYSQAQIYDAVWQQPDLGDPHTVQVHIGRARKKLESVYQQHSFIQTVWGAGYKFVPLR